MQPLGRTEAFLTDESEIARTDPPAGSSNPVGSAALWPRVRDHKVIQWSVAYLGVALALAQGQDIVAGAFGWPDAVGRVFIVALFLGFPIAVALAWYHGHRGLTSVGAGELMVISLLVLIGALLLTVTVRPAENQAASAALPPVAPVPANDAAAGAPSAVPSPPVPDVLPNSVAVLPFENLSTEDDKKYFADGIHREVISQLGKLSNLTVIPRASVIPYADGSFTIPQVAAELRVRSVLAASVLYAGNRVRIIPELIDAQTSRLIWSETYERELADVWTIQADIAMNIANALSAEFSPAEQRALERVPTSSPEAYTYYLQAQTLALSGETGTMDAAQALLQRALNLDPEFGAAYGARAQLYSISFANTALGAGAAADRRSELERLVRENADRALALDPAEVNARAALRGMSIPTWSWSLFRRMVEPRDEADLSVAQVWVFAWMGDTGEALRIARKAAEINSNARETRFTWAVTEAYAGDRLGSSRILNEGAESSPPNALGRAWLAYNAIVLGDDDEALAELELAERLLGAAPSLQSIAFFPELAYAYSRIGRDADARRMFETIETLARSAFVDDGTWALAYLAIGNEDEALRRLAAVAEKARNHEVDLGYINVMNLKMNFLADPRLDEPRFATVLEQIRGD